MINEFILSGYSVAVLKHDGQDHIEEVKGTDTFRYKEAGAFCTVVYSDSGYVLSAGRKKKEPFVSPEWLIEEIKRQPEPPDIILLEGFKYSKYPKVEIVRGEAASKSVADPATLICIATDFLSPEEVNCPVFGPDDIPGIFSCIKKWFSLD